MISNEIRRTITVSSLKGNTLGILQKLESNKFSSAMHIKGRNSPVKFWEESDSILLGVSSYQRSDSDTPSFPKQIEIGRAHV